MKHLQLFEEFNPYTGKQFADKLKIYAEASDITKSVSPYTFVGNTITFDIYTNIPGDFDKGEKVFKVSIPTDIVSKSYVDTYEGGKKVLRASLETDSENDINNILMNYIEVCGLYDDSSTEYIVDAYKDITSIEDIKKIIKNMG
jgi:hypothetical protein